MPQGNSAIKDLPSDGKPSKSDGALYHRLMRQGWSFSGHERHCVYLNVDGKRFANVSGVSGLDIPDDGRGLARVDWDHDGDLDFWISNRSGPQVRFLRNEVPTNNHFLALRLEGRKCNRDAIGARVEVVVKSEGRREKGEGRRVKTLRAGEGFLSQSSKWIHFGLEDVSQIDRVIVHWPGGEPEIVTGLEVDRHYHLVQNSGAQLWQPPSRGEKPASSPLPPADKQLGYGVFSAIPPLLPRLEYRTFDNQPAYLPTRPKRPLLVNLFASWCQPCVQELAEWTHRQNEVEQAGIDVIALSVDELSQEHGSSAASSRQLLERIEFPFEYGYAEPGLVDKLQIMNDRMVDDHRILPVPTSVLIDTEGRLAAIYKGAVKIDQVLEDAGNLKLKGAKRWRVTQRFPGKRLGKIYKFSELRLGVRLREDGFLDDAIEYVDRNEALLSKEPDYHRLLTDIGTGLHVQGRSREAKRFLQAAVRTQPDFAIAYDILAQVAEALGQDEEAISNYQRAIELAPEKGDTHSKLAELQWKRGNKQEALKHLQASTRYAPDHAPRYVGIAKLLAASGKTEEAIRSLRTAIQKDPQLVEAHAGLGLLLIQTGRVAEGVAAMRRVVELTPNNAEANCQLGIVLENTGNTDEALVQFRKTLQIDENYSEAHLRLAVLLERLGDTAAAVSHYQSRLRHVPGDLAAMTHLARILATHPDEQIRDGAQALRLARQAAQATAGRRPDVLSTLAAAYAEVGRFNEAVKQITVAIQLAKTANQQQLVESLQTQLKKYENKNDGSDP